METLASGFGLVEAPVWIDDRGLLFSDVTFGGVFALGSDGVVSPVFEHRRGIGGMVEHMSGGMVVSGRNIALKPFDGGATLPLLEQDQAAGHVGFNDITTDTAGRIYAGALALDPFGEASERRPGDLRLIDLDGSSRIVATDVLLTNGLGFSPDASRLYHSDSLRSAVMCYEVAADGSLGPKQQFAHTERGAPDGLAVATDGSVWVALAAGGRGVVAFAPDGTERDFVEIAEPMCTSVCFGGPDLRDLYIVSGSDGSDSDRAGSVHRVRTDVAGVPVPPARISPAAS